MKSVNYYIDYQIHGQCMDRVWGSVRSRIITQVRIKIREEIKKKSHITLKLIQGEQ